jgi:outer membrane protein TolC
MFRAAALVTAFAVAVPAAASSRQEVDTLRLATALAMAREMNPGLRAAVLRADAEAARVPQAGAPPDPMLSFGLMNWAIDGFGPTEPMSMNSVQITQRFPWPGKLHFGEERARQLAVAQRFDAAEAEVGLVARVKATYFQLAFMDRALDIMTNTQQLLRVFLGVAQTMYAVGSVPQQDVLMAQVAVAQMTEEITAMGQNRVAMTARLNALLGREPTGTIGALELPNARDTLPSVDSLMAIAARERPALAAAQARTDAAAAGYAAARRAVYPDITVTLGYGQRPDFKDLTKIMFGLSVPLWGGSRQLPMRREMLAMQSAEEARERNLYNETFARLAELRAEAVRARNLASLYANAVLPQARAATESALSAYRVGGVNYSTLVQNEMTVNRYAVQRIALTVDYLRAVSEIDALIGRELGGV